MHRLTLLVALVCSLWMAGCQKRNLSYRYQSPVLIPPAVKSEAASPRPVPFSAKPDCLPDLAGIAVDHRGGKVRLTVDRAKLETQPAGSLRQWGAALEKPGCLKAGEGLAKAQELLESVAMDPKIAFNLLRPNPGVAGYADLGAEHRLRVITPITAGPGPILEETKISGTDSKIDVVIKTTPNFLGYQTAWFSVAGGRLKLRSAEDRQGDHVLDTHAPRFPLTVPKGTRYLRLFYLTRVSKSDHDIALMTAPDAHTMEERTRQFNERPDCSAFPPGVCIAVPKETAISPFLVAIANGVEVTVPIGATVRDALRTAGVTPEEALKTLAISRPYRGRPVPVVFDRTQAQILSLPLLGGEVLRW